MDNNFELLLKPAITILSEKKLVAQRIESEVFNNWIVESSLAKALNYAWSADDDMVEVWTDLREQHLASIEYGDAYGYWSETYSEKLETYLDSIGLAEIYSDVESDLFHCCANRIAKNHDAFWDIVLEAYTAGVWPCGWVGQKYPNGKLVVFSQKL